MPAPARPAPLGGQLEHETLDGEPGRGITTAELALQAEGERGQLKLASLGAPLERRPELTAIELP